MARTKLVKSAGKFGARYGRSIRKRVISVNRTRKKKYMCSNCMKSGVRRISSGIWTCNKCGLKFAGKAYKPS